jgi:glycosidase
MMRLDGLLSPWEKETLQDVRGIINTRDKNSALRHGDYYSLQADTNNYIYIRSDMNQRILVALNKSDKPEKLTINLPAAYKLSMALDLLNSSSRVIKDNSLELEIPGMIYKILSLK